jgi:hypothetical protein
MRKRPWRVVERMAGDSRGIPGQLVLLCWPGPLDVVLYEAPVVLRTHPPRNALRGFFQEAVRLLGGPSAEDLSRLLGLPPRVTDLVLGDLNRLGAVAVNAAGQWSVPPGAPHFTADGDGPEIEQHARQLLCYWEGGDVLLPVLPRMRLRDLVHLQVHRIEGRLSDWYRRMAGWEGPEAARHGKPAGLTLLPPEAAVNAGPDGAGSHPAPGTGILAAECKLDVIGLTWAGRREGVWELHTRLWSRPAPAEEGHGGEPYAPGEPVGGLTVLDRLLGGNALGRLGSLFDFDRERWKELLSDDSDLRHVRRSDGGHPTLLVTSSSPEGDAREWRFLNTRLGDHAFLVCCREADRGEGPRHA